MGGVGTVALEGTGSIRGAVRDPTEASRGNGNGHNDGGNGRGGEVMAETIDRLPANGSEMAINVSYGGRVALRGWLSCGSCTD